MLACAAWGLGSGLGLACGPDDRPPGASGSAGASTSSASDETGSGTADETGLETGLDAGLDTGSSDTGAPAPAWDRSLEVGDEVGAFFSVWGPTPDLVYAVAGQPLRGGQSRGALQRWDGTQWQARPLPDDVPALNWVFGVGSRRFLVGDLGVILVRDGDEGEWTRYGCGTILPLWGVWAAAPDDAWAVGGDGFNRDPVACHFDGDAWTLVELPEPSMESHALYKVWGTAADDVWAVGDEGLLMRYGGAAAGWVEVPSGTEFDLISIWGTGPDEILAVGGRTTGVLSRFDGAQWTAAEIPALPGLNGVWMAPDGTALVVGPQGGVGVVASGALSVEVQDGGTSLALHGVFGLSPSPEPPLEPSLDEAEQWAVGGSLDMAPPYVGVILHRTP